MTNSKQRVFVVDDEPVIAMTLAQILYLEGYDVIAFTDPKQALEAFRHTCADLLVSDVMMPGLTGVDLAIHVKTLCPSCQVLLISGNATTIDLLSSARERGHDFLLLAKPIAPPQLIEAIRSSFQRVALPAKSSRRS